MTLSDLKERFEQKGLVAAWLTELEEEFGLPELFYQGLGAFDEGLLCDAAPSDLNELQRHWWLCGFKSAEEFAVHASLPVDDAAIRGYEADRTYQAFLGNQLAWALNPGRLLAE